MYTKTEINNSITFLTDLSTYLYTKGQSCHRDDFLYYFNTIQLLRDTILVIEKYTEDMMSLSENPITKEGE